MKVETIRIIVNEKKEKIRVGDLVVVKTTNTDPKNPEPMFYEGRLETIRTDSYDELCYIEIKPLSENPYNDYIFFKTNILNIEKREL